MPKVPGLSSSPASEASMSFGGSFNLRPDVGEYCNFIHEMIEWIGDELQTAADKIFQRTATA